MDARTDRDLFPWILGTSLLAALALVAFAASHYQPPASPVAAPAPPPHPLITSRTMTAPLPPEHHVWECQQNGQEIFSDEPCGPVSGVRDIRTPNRMDRAPLRPDIVPDPPTAYGEDSATNYASDSEASQESPTCASLRAQVDVIQARLRQPHGNADGAFCRERLRELTDQQYELHCVR